MLEHLKNELNKTFTLNGAEAFKSTRSAVLDLFGRGASLRTNLVELEHLIREAFNENDELALRTVFYLADVRGGQGTRDVMKAGIKVLVERHPSIVEKLMPLFVEYTRWDMLYEFVGTKFERAAFQTMLKSVVAAQTTGDYLVFKWLKSADATSKETRHLGYLTAKYFDMDLRTYRKFLTNGRSKLNLVENALTHKQYEKIDYSHIPSKANLKYRTAFFRNDEARYRAFLDSVIKGEVKMNMNVGYPHEIVSAYVKNGGWYANHTLDNSLEAAWKSLPNFLGDGEENLLVVADVSGSMGTVVPGATSVTAMDVSVALAIYTAQRNHGHFHNNFLTFSAEPALMSLSDKDTLKDAINKVGRAPWGMNTDIDAVFKLLLNTAVKNRLPQSDMPSTIIIVSDMQFDACVRGGRNFKHWEVSFTRDGYELPKIVFWNVMDYGNVPVTAKENGTALISGYSPSILEFIYNGNIVTPYDFMLKVILTPRYDRVMEAIK